MGGMWNGTGPWAGTGMWGMGSGTAAGMSWLVDDPATLQAWLTLRAEHQAEMQTWFDTYRTDHTSPAAQQALHDLWTAHWNEMMAFSQRYAPGQDWTFPSSDMWSGWMMGSMMSGLSWDPAGMWGAGYGADWMTAHPAGMGRWMALRSRQLADTSAWAQSHGGDLSGPAAQTALTALMARHRAEVRTFYKHSHIAPTRTRMHYGTGGWMGLGGMWGGWGR